jgi:hypothetical protein
MEYHEAPVPIAHFSRAVSSIQWRRVRAHQVKVQIVLKKVHAFNYVWVVQETE